mmetsp:Transcript_27626/g.92429  ORF Transcript_27626/g.92429 Transcript_27626/m.92429 type:complete len:205 (+) Transcript_27626:111-725(+)
MDCIVAQGQGEGQAVPPAHGPRVHAGGRQALSVPAPESRAPSSASCAHGFRRHRDYGSFMRFTSLGTKFSAGGAVLVSPKRTLDPVLKSWGLCLPEGAGATRACAGTPAAGASPFRLRFPEGKACFEGEPFPRGCSSVMAACCRGTSGAAWDPGACCPPGTPSAPWSPLSGSSGSSRAGPRAASRSLSSTAWREKGSFSPVRLL